MSVPVLRIAWEKDCHFLDVFLLSTNRTRDFTKKRVKALSRKARDRRTSWIILDSGQPRTLPQPLGGVEITGLRGRNHPDNHSPKTLESDRKAKQSCVDASLAFALLAMSTSEVRELHSDQSIREVVRGPSLSLCPLGCPTVALFFPTLSE